MNVAAANARKVANPAHALKSLALMVLAVANLAVANPAVANPAVANLHARLKVVLAKESFRLAINHASEFLGGDDRWFS